MRTLMVICSILLLVVGTFCMANSTVPFVSVAFLIGIVVLALGICELIVMRVSTIRNYEPASDVSVEGLVSIILGIVFLSGQMIDGVAVTALFALWTTIEGVKSISNANYDIRNNTTTDNIMLAMGIVTAIFGTYMFFNSLLFNLRVLLMVGIALFLIGVNRFKIALGIEYKAPEFMTGNEEKLAEAKLAEKQAMARAKEAIRDTKAAQRRIEKINKEIAKERSMQAGVEARRSAKNQH